MELSISRCAERFADGEPVLVPEEPSGGTLLALAAAGVQPQGLARLSELAGNMVMLALEGEIADRLVLRLPTQIDAAACRDGGWSLADRALTMRLAAAQETTRRDLTVPGHVPAMRADRSTVSSAAEGVSAAIELAHAIGMPGAVALAAALDRAGRPVSFTDACRDPRLRGLPRASREELRGRLVARSLELEAVDCWLPTRAGAFRAAAFAHGDDGEVTAALVHGDVAVRTRVAVYEHVHCLLGDTFASTLCGCRVSLDRATEAIVGDGAGVILYTKRPPLAPFACPGERHQVDPAVAAALLARAGVRGRMPV